MVDVGAAFPIVQNFPRFFPPGSIASTNQLGRGQDEGLGSVYTPIPRSHQEVLPSPKKSAIRGTAYPRKTSLPSDRKTSSKTPSPKAAPPPRMRSLDDDCVLSTKRMTPFKSFTTEKTAATNCLSSLFARPVEAPLTCAT